MIDAGLFRMLSPKAFGGLEIHPVEAFRVVEAVARIDSAAGWNLNQSYSISGACAWLPKEGGEELFGNGPDAICAGGFFPGGPSVRVEGGWRVTARSGFASGCHRAQWFGVPIVEVAEDASHYDPRTEDPPTVIALIPRDEIDLLDTWHTSGMRGTFSADVSVDDVFVPDHTVSFIERRRDRAHAKARGLVDASRAFVHAAMSEAFSEAETDGCYSEATKLRCQLAACFGVAACAEAVDLVHEVAGGSAIRLEHEFERHHRDIHVLTQHAYKSSSRYEDVGKILFGLPPAFWSLDL